MQPQPSLPGKGRSRGRGSFQSVGGSIDRGGDALSRLVGRWAQGRGQWPGCSAPPFLRVQRITGAIAAACRDIAQRPSTSAVWGEGERGEGGGQEEGEGEPWLGEERGAEEEVGEEGRQGGFVGAEGREGAEVEEGAGRPVSDHAQARLPVAQSGVAAPAPAAAPASALDPAAASALVPAPAPVSSLQSAGRRQLSAVLQARLSSAPNGGRHEAKGTAPIPHHARNRQAAVVPIRCSFPPSAALPPGTAPAPLSAALHAALGSLPPSAFSPSAPAQGHSSPTQHDIALFVRELLATLHAAGEGQLDSPGEPCP